MAPWRASLVIFLLPIAAECTVDPRVPYNSTSGAWPLSPWSVDILLENGYAPLPCANYRYIEGLRAPGCKKRIPAAETYEQFRERREFYDAVWLTGPYDADPLTVNDWQYLHRIGSEPRVEVRIGMSISLSGSLADAQRNSVILETLSLWAEAMGREDPRTCYSFCVLDDESNEQSVHNIYRHLTDVRFFYDVDIVLGPASYELRETAALFANIFQKPLLLWSTPSHWYTLGQGPTRDPGVAIDALPIVFLEIMGSNWAPRTAGTPVFVYYHQRNGQPGERTREEVVLQGAALIFRHMGELTLWSREPIMFEIQAHPEDKEGDLDTTLGVTQVYGSFVYEDLVDSETVTKRMELYDALSGEALEGRWLEVKMRYVRNSWARYFADFAGNFTRALDQEQHALAQEQAQQAAPHGSSSLLLKQAHSGTLNGPNKRTSDFGGPAAMETRQQEMEALAASLTEPYRQLNHSVWQVRGPCSVDEDDCLTTPNYPNHYGNLEVCAVTVDVKEVNIRRTLWKQAVRLHMADMDTERLHDLLWISGAGRFHSGQDRLKNMVTEDAGLIVWQSDASKTARGWRLCPSIFDGWQMFCIAHICPEGMAKLPGKPCDGVCTDEFCCKAVDRSVEGHFWDQKFKHVFDITPPKQQWLTDAFSRLQAAGAKSLWVAFTPYEEPHCRSWGLNMYNAGWQVNGDRLPYGVTDWFEVALQIDIAGMDVLLICGDAMVVNSILAGLVTLRSSTKAILLAEPLGISLQGNTGPASRMNYVLEPLPWPSLEWMMQTFRESYVKWMARLITEFKVPSLLTFQLQTVAQILSLVTSGLSSANASVLDQRLQILGTSDLPCTTLLGNIRFGESGQRVGDVPVATTQRFPLPQVLETESPASTAWDYWRARSLLSQHMLLVNSTEDTAALLRSLLNQASRPQQDFVLGIPDWTPPETVLRSPMATPREDFFADLVFPRPPFETSLREVYPCPKGCQNDGYHCTACAPGRFRGYYEETCRDCETGTQTALWVSDVCQACPLGSSCSSEAWQEMAAQPGYWRVPRVQAIPTGPDSCSPESGLYPEQLDEAPDPSPQFLSCSPLPWLCLGGAENRCVGNNVGVLCRMCPDGYSWMHYGSSAQKCMPCPSHWYIVAQICLQIMVYAGICFVINKAVKYGANAANSLLLPLFRLLFEHFTTQNMIIESMGLGKSNTEFLPITDMLTRPTEIASLDCFLSGESVSANVAKVRGQIVISLGLLAGGFAVVPLILLFRLVLRTKHDSRLLAQKDSIRDSREPKFSDKLSERVSGFTSKISGGDKYSRVENTKIRRRLGDDAVRHFCIWLYVSLPCMLRVGIRPLVCIDAGLGDTRVESFPAIPCNDEEYLRDVWPLAVGVVIVYAAVVPCLLFYLLHQAHGFTNEVSCISRIGVFSQGYKRQYFWFEVVMVFRWIMQLLAMLITDARLRAALVFVLFMSIECIEEQLRPFVPLDRDALRHTFDVSFKVHLITLSLGMVRLLAGEVRDTESASFYVESLASYEVTMVVIVLTANCLLVLVVLYLVWYNWVAVPLVRIQNATGPETLTPLQQFIVKLAKRLRGENSMRVTSSPQYFSLELVKLDDYERSFLVSGLMTCAESVLQMKQWRFCTAWILQVLKASFRMVHDDHKARLLMRASRAMERSLTGTPSGGRNSKGSMGGTPSSLTRAGTWLHDHTPSLPASKIKGGRSWHQSYYDVDIRDNTLVDEITVALNYVGLDLQDGIVGLTYFDLEPLQKHQPEKTRTAVSVPEASGAPRAHDGDKQEEDLAGVVHQETYFHTWRGEIGEKLLLPQIDETKRHKKPTGAEARNLVGKSLSQGVADLDVAVNVADEPRGYDSASHSSGSSDTEEVTEVQLFQTNQERRMHLQHLIMEANAELQELRGRWRELGYDPQYKQLTHGSFIQEHKRFARDDSRAPKPALPGPEEAVVPTASLYSSEASGPHDNSEEEHSAIDEEKPVDHLKTMFRQLEDERVEWKAPGKNNHTPLDELSTLDRKDKWYEPFAVSEGGGGPAHVPKPKRVPLPPPSAPPSARDKRVVLLPDLPVDTSVADDDPPRVPPALAPPSFSTSSPQRMAESPRKSATETPTSEAPSDLGWCQPASRPRQTRRASRAAAIVAPAPGSGKMIMSL